MKGNTGIFVFAFALIVVCFFASYGSYSAVKPEKTQGEEVAMVQPCGWFWCADYDQQYAEHVNEPNSRANLNNGQARVYDAQAKQIEVETYKSENNTDFKAGAGIGFYGALLVMVLALLFMLSAWKRS